MCAGNRSRPLRSCYEKDITMRFNVPSMLDKSAYLDYALVPVCLTLWAIFGGWEWPVSALVSLLAAYTKPLPRFHQWLLRRMTRSTRPTP